MVLLNSSKSSLLSPSSSFSRIEPKLVVDRAARENRQPGHKLLEVNVAAPIGVKDVYHAPGERILADSGNRQKLVLVDGPGVVCVQLHEPLRETVNFVGSDWMLEATAANTYSLFPRTGRPGDSTECCPC
ncbi:hypothetical protein KL938_000823 [Ogataea parapolymorpha]|nr:hypothetical protein KL938_000823 [Ogataea parapolymorpha]